MAEEVRLAFESRGYCLRTRESGQKTDEGRSLIEVYPHPALLRLTSSEERVPYKVEKTKTYWPNASLESRRALVVAVLEDILIHLRAAGIGGDLPRVRGDSFQALKAVEDMVDAVVCAWVGVQFLNGMAEAFGNADAAIWIPRANKEGSG